MSVKVKRIVTNIKAKDVAGLRDFYAGMFDLDIAMDMGWIATLTAGSEKAPVQISIASEGGSGTPLPDVTIEVEDVDALFARARALAHEVVYPLTDEPWGVRRFYLRDPAGTVINVAMHL